MRNIRKFETFEDFLASQESVSGSGKYVQDIWPGFAYVKENYPEEVYAIYNGEEPEDYEFGDIVYYDGSDKLKKVYWSAFTPSMGEKVGLIVVPTSLSPDGNARMMAFGSIATEQTIAPLGSIASEQTISPTKGDTVLGASGQYVKLEADWYGPYMDENQTVYTCVPGFYLTGNVRGGGDTVLAKASAPGSEGQPSYYEEPLSLDMATNMDQTSPFSSDAHSLAPNPHTNGEYFNVSTGYTVAISPFLGDGFDKQDPAYLQESLTGGSTGPGEEEIKAKSPKLGATPALGGGNYNAFSDFSGYTWTYGCPPEVDAGGGERENTRSAQPGTELKSSNPIAGGLVGAYFPHNYARMFSTDGTQQGDWYLPSAGEMGFVIARYKMITEQIFEYLYSVGAWNNDGTDNIPGQNFNGESYSNGMLWVSSVGTTGNGGGIEAAQPLGASILGDDTYPEVSSMIALINAYDGSSPASTAKPEILGAGNSYQYNLALGTYSTGSSTKGSNEYPEILPFAMIKGGKIQRTMGDYTVANGHQVKDFYYDNNAQE